MPTNQESTTAQHEPRERRATSANRSQSATAVPGDSDRRGLQLALTDALSDILRWEAAEANQAEKTTKAARH